MNDCQFCPVDDECYYPFKPCRRIKGQEIKMESYKGKDGSFIHNCIIERRENDKSDYLFKISSEDHNVSAFLNGYAIIPLETYIELTGKDFSNMIAKAEESEKLLHPDRY